MAEDLFRNPEALKHLAVYDRDGRPVGSVDQVYVDDRYRRPMWLAVRTGPAGPEVVFVPLRGARSAVGGRGLRLAYTRRTIEEAPRIEADQHLDLAQEQELHAHYDVAPPRTGASGAPGVGPARPWVPLTGAEAAGTGEAASGPPAGRSRLGRFVPVEEERFPSIPGRRRGEYP